jgi:hypothetical protein
VKTGSIGETAEDTHVADSRTTSTTRVVAVVLLLAAVLAYSVAVVSGAIPKDRQIDSAHLTLIALTVLASALILRPRILGRIERFEGLGFKFELLQRLQDQQVEQAVRLYDVDMLVPLLFRDGDRKHLINLVQGTTKGYKGGAALRDELRRLRSIGLIRSAHDRHIADLHSTVTFDLADWVTLTDVGRRWASRLKRLEEAATETPGTNGNQ